MTAADPTLSMPALPALADPVGSLDHVLATRADLAADEPFAVTGRRSCVTGGAARGVDQVRVHPLRLAAGPRVTGAVCEAATITPLGGERRLRVGDVVVVERVVVPRDAPFALLEWHAGERAVGLEIEWTMDLAGWQRGPRSLVGVGPVDGARAACVLSAEPDSLTVERVAGKAARLRVRASATIRQGVGLRLAMAGAGDDGALERTLRAANRTRAVVQGRRGLVERILEDRLAITSAHPALDRAVAEAKVRLDARLVESPGVGRSLVAAYGPAAPSYETAGSVRGALDALLIGDFEAARDVLVFLGRHQDATGLVPARVATSGEAGPGDPDATVQYLRLAGRYHAWSGDSGVVREEWPRILVAWAQVGGAIDWEVVRGLVHLAEALGDEAAAASLRGARDAGTGHAAGLEAEAAEAVVAPGTNDGALRTLRAVLGAEPDAARGRLTLRPRPPMEWDQFEVRGLRMGDAAFTLAWRRDAGSNRFTIRQDRGRAPATLVLEATVPGPLRAARVDGVPADLAPVDGVGGVRVPVQLALDHERVVELEG